MLVLGRAGRVILIGAAIAARQVVGIHLTCLALIPRAARAGILVGAEVPTAAVYVVHRLQRQERASQRKDQGFHLFFGQLLR